VIRNGLLLLILLAASCTLCAQGYYFRHYQVENGLSNSTVFCATQDSNGFLWFGTKDGINRFDGYTFKIFRHDPANPASLGDNSVYSVLDDTDGGIWVGTERGLFYFDASTERFHLVPETQHADTRDLDRDNQGNLYFINDLRLFRYNRRTDSLPQEVPASMHELPSAICRSADGNLWMACKNGILKKYDVTKQQIVSAASIFDHSEKTPSLWIEEIYDTGKDRVLAATSGQGIKLLNSRDNTYTDILTYNPDKTTVYGRDIVHYAGDEYWLATESGVFIYNLQTGLFTNLRKQYNDPYSISDNAIYSLCRDKEGGLWAGTYFGGVNYYPKQHTSFQKFFPNYSENAISGNAVREICEDDFGHLWIGTEDGGLNKIKRSTGKLTHYMPTGSKTSIAYSNIHGLLPLGDKLWIGTFVYGLDIMDIASGKVVKHYNEGDKHRLPASFVMNIIKTKNSALYLTTSHGVCRYNPRADTFAWMPAQMGNTFIHNMYEDHAGTLWVATRGEGIYYYNPRTGKQGNMRHVAGNANSLSTNLVNSVFEDRNQHLWFATEGGGLCRYVPATNKFTRYTTKEGLPSNYVFMLLEDGQGNLWISTSKGLVRFNAITGKMKIFTRANGLLNDQFNYNSAYKDKQGRMFFGSVKGMISFNPDEFTISTFTPPVFITGFQVNNQELTVTQGSPLQQSILYTREITLAYNESSFSIDFAALSYLAPEMTEYAYKMEGLDQHDWIYLKTNRKVYFTDLAAGKYAFHVKATDSNGEWNGQVTRLVIRVLPPWWASTWAYLLYALAAGVVIYYFIRSYHLKTVQKNKRRIELLEHRKETELYQAKIEFFTNVAHEIRTPLTLIKAPLEKVMKKAEGMPDMENNLKVMERNTNRLIDLTNQLLDFRQTEARGFSLNFTPVNMSELLEETYINFKPLAEQKNIRFHLQLPPQAIQAPADAEAVIKILSNLFSNAVKYAQGEVVVCLQQPAPNDPFVTITVANDGFLIPAAMREKIFEPFFRLKETEKQKGTGIGLALSRSLATLHKGALYLAPATDHMNTFVLQLPQTP
jgi:ligand-binding sensor domain-containing protein/signal transduction histidine kinase